MNDEWDTFKTTELQSAQNYVTMNTVKDRILKVKAAYKGKHHSRRESVHGNG